MNDNNDIKDGWREELEDYFVIKGMYTTYETIQCNLRVDLVVNYIANSTDATHIKNV